MLMMLARFLADVMLPRFWGLGEQETGSAADAHDAGLVLE